VVSERDLDFDEWYAAVRPRMIAALSGWCGDAGIASEAIDEAFVRAVEHWTKVSTSPSPEGWVWRTATNVVRRRMRRQQMEQRLLRRNTQHREHDGPAPRDEDLIEALQELTERQRTVVVLHYIADKPIAEIATMLHIASGTVTATLHQARTRLAERLAPAHEPDPEPKTRIDGVLP
jgi:RNA polymerase sigma-70 factor (ECF subfamily)